MNNKQICGIALLLSILIPASAAGQSESEWKTQCGTPTGQERFPLTSFSELPTPGTPDAETWKRVKGINFSWGNTDTRYSKLEVPAAVSGKKTILKGWRGEKVHAQAVIWTNEDINNLSFEISPLKGKAGSVIGTEHIESGFVRSVMTDLPKDEEINNCGVRPDHRLYDSTMVADCIDHLLEHTKMQKMQTQGIWISCTIPQNATPGTYKGTVTIKNGEKAIGYLSLDVIADKHILPEPKDWKFHLDLWQNPYAVARYYQVEPWSEEHMEVMRPIMKRLADAGQKVITASIMHKPWNGQTEDPFETMVTWMKKIDGSWEFSFEIFDKWVEYMMELGIDQQINCYSMIPWKLSFQYFDQATNTLKFANTAPGEKEYEDMWSNMLSAFSEHLKEKGWFDICTIAMDERPMETMLKAIAIIRKANPDFKISLAGNFHEELERDIYDYCIGVLDEYPEEVLAKRKFEGKVTTLYTCCAEKHPNTFTFSAPAEATWLGCHMAARNVDGYLRWAYNSWTLEPLLDTRFRTWAGGDTYIVYPGNRTSIRFERLLEGVQMYEKTMTLKEEYKKSGNIKALAELEDALAKFDINSIPGAPASEHVNNLRNILNK